MNQMQMVIVCYCLKTISDQTGESPETMINVLTGIMWSEEEAGQMKRLIVEATVEVMFESDPDQAMQLLGLKKGEDDDAV